MLTTLPSYITITFIITTLLTLFFFYKAIQLSSDAWTRSRSMHILFGFCIWLGIHAFISYSGFYASHLDALPPWLVRLALLPNFLVMAILFLSENGRQFIDGLSLKYITYLNMIRVPVEFVLLWLSLSLVIPDIMTFEGWNFDILAGLTAPVMAYLYFTKKSIGKRALLLWNFICLVLLVNVLIIGLLSAPFPLQQFGFEQPNIALLHFPFVWLPVFIVPIVLFGHFVSIRRLIN